MSCPCCTRRVHKESKAIIRQRGLALAKSYLPPLYEDLPVLTINNQLITTTNFSTYTLNGKEYTLQNLQRLFWDKGLSRAIYENLKTVQKTSESIVRGLAVLNRLMELPTAYENDEDKLLPEVVCALIKPYLISRYMIPSL